MFGLNRVVCEVLEEMRACYKTYNFSTIPGLIEEVQTMVNRMEAKLNDYGDSKYLIEDIKDLKEEQKQLRLKIKKLKNNKLLNT